MTTFMIDAPALRRIVDELAAGNRQDQGLRGLQGPNAPTAKYFQTGTLTAAGITTLAQSLNPGSEVFYCLVVVFWSVSGQGFYTITPDIPTVTGNGFEIPPGGGVLPIFGMNNIAQFKMIAAAGQTLPWSAAFFV